KTNAVCGSIILDAGYPEALYTWNNSAITRTIQSTSSGWNVVTVTDQNGCSGTDSIFVNILTTPSVNIGTDTVMCKPVHPHIILPNSNALSHIWNTGAASCSLAVEKPG